ncbi:MAG: HypC/HybG/HupF family hydrogenase formation chaperone [Chloroflexi bacterium]|nr:HypC/HybG/HupF family hydrogenase formation chaperone [Chloroflexota bacterium]
MCLTAPARVLSVAGTFADVEQDGRRRRASLLLLNGIEPGDWVLVGAGTALRRLDAEEAEELIDLLRAARDATPPVGSVDQRNPVAEPRGALS